MANSSHSRNRFARALAFALACCVVLFLVQLVVHAHEKGHNEVACRVCHAAHLGFAPPLASLLLCAPLLSSDRLREIAVNIHKKLFALDAPSRAPPPPRSKN